MQPKKYSIWIIGAIAFFAFTIFSTVIALIADWWWFSEIGHTEIFIKSLGAKTALGLGVAVFVFLFLLVNILISTSSKIPWFMVLPESIMGRPISLSSRLTRRLGIVISLLVAILLGFVASTGWQDWLSFLEATPFGVVDPIFEKDISFYLFSIPVISLGLGLLKTLVLVSIALVGAIYVFRGSLNLAGLLGKFLALNMRTASQFDSEELLQKENLTGARNHIASLLSMFLLTIAIGAYVSIFKLLTNQTGQIYGAASTDVFVMIPLLWVSVFVALLASFAAIYWGKSGKTKFLIGTVVLYFLVGFASSIIPSVFQKLIVAPNELVKETPFIKNNIEATRAAYGLDKVEEREISGDKPLTKADIAKNNPTIKNVRLWERAPLLSTFSQIQEIRTYYEFASVDNDRYIINGETRQIMLSPRELPPEPNRNWINERLTFTHGYGVAAGPVNQVTAEGLPVLFVKDLPPQSSVKELQVTRPEIYYGELSSDYVFVKTKSKEFDYPKGEENVYSVYEGKGGVEMNSFVKRLFYAIHFRSLKIFLSNDITNESRILYNRDIKKRALKVAPFLTFDRDPYSVIADGKIYWIADAYTTSNLYPYSQPTALNGVNVNYIRNSVKVVIDAYDGATTLYITDTEDPIIRTYAKIFPNTFRPMTEMPKSLIAHIRYPEDIFALQTAIYTNYHMTEPQIFYNKEDQWEVPIIAGAGEQNAAGKSGAMAPRHMIMKLPGEKKEEYVLMLPFTPRAKDNLSAWMVARNDGADYGKLVVYRFPKQKLIFGPKQVIGRINQDTEISRQIALWDQGGSQVIQGSLLVIPIEESLIYVRSLYLKARDGKIPELKRVLVSYENKVAMEETLEVGLARIFGGSTPALRNGSGEVGQAIPISTLNTAELTAQANQTYENALRAQREGDWTRYGEEIRKLGEILKRLR